MLEVFGHWLLKRSRHAWVTAGLFAPLPILGWVSAVICVLVTLRQGLRAGALVALAASLPFIIWLATHDEYSLYLLLKLVSIPLVWLIAGVLRQWRSWYWVLMVMTGLGVLAVALTHLFIGDTQQFWQLHIISIVDGMIALATEQEMDVMVLALQFYLTLLQQQGALAYIASIATGLLVLNLMFSVLFQLIAARYWQAQLFNPDGLQDELHQIRLTPIDSLLFAGCCLAAMMHFSLFIDMLPIVVVPFAFVGMCFMHWYFQVRSWSKFAFYSLCVGVALFVPYSIVMLVSLAIFDSVVDFRKKLCLVNEPNETS